MGQFERQMRVLDIENELTPVGLPSMNCYAERAIGSIRRELLRHIRVADAKELQFFLDEYRRYANTERPHQGIGGRTPPMFNITVSNVPGPTEPLYFRGAELVAIYPASIVTHGQALNITCESYAGQMNFGYTGCHSSVPSLQRLAVYSADALAELEAALLAATPDAAAEPTEAAPASPPAARRRRARPKSEVDVAADVAVAPAAAPRKRARKPSAKASSAVSSGG